MDKMYIMYKELNIQKKTFSNKDSLFMHMQPLVYHPIKDSFGKKGYDNNKVTALANLVVNTFLNKEIKAEEKKKKIEEYKKVFEGEHEISLPDLYSLCTHAYRASRYEAVLPTNERALRNNKIFDMTYSIMTHETTADKMLNPGGFDQQKKIGYQVATFINLSEKTNDEETLIKLWNSLENKSIEELKEMAYKDSNLCFIDTQIKFYNQNNAAGSLIGIFAVHKVAHAFLGNDDFKYAGNFNPFVIGSNTIYPGIPIDPEKDYSGQWVGKVLGSLVASAADAVKDPVLNLMNINNETAVILCTLVRLGIPFDTAAMFLSQKVIKDILTEKSTKGLDKYISLSEIVLKRIEDIENEHKISEDSTIEVDKLSTKELIVGIKGGNIAIDYKVLKALSTIINISNDLRGLSYVTRFNSISNAVGPLVIDNLIMENKLNNFPETIIDSENNTITVGVSFDS